MLTVEYRVNGQIIGFTNIHNIDCLPGFGGKYLYEWEHLSANNATRLSGEVTHNKDDGYERLVSEVLKRVIKKGQDMRRSERVRRQKYIDSDFSRDELLQIREEICCDCKGNNSYWWDSDCRYFCDAFYLRLQQLDAETYI